MIHVTYPDSKPRVRNLAVQPEIYCIIRKKWVRLTPEEWVRQNMLLFVTEAMNYPKAVIAVEKKIVLGAVTRRFDILVYDENSCPWMIIECKEMKVSLTDATIQQVLNYHSKLQGNFIVVTNGSFTRGFDLRSGINELAAFPPFAPM